MGAPKTVQEARKANQEDRLARKAAIVTEEDAAAYADWYRNQPQQLERAKLHALHQTHVNALAGAVETVGIAEVTGVGLEDAKHNLAVAQLVVERSTVPKRGAAVKSVLTAANGSN